MDLMTDLQIIQDLLDASSRRCVAVYAVLEVSGLPHFLDMCSRLQVNATHLRVRKRRRGAGRGGWLGFARDRLPSCSRTRSQAGHMTSLRGLFRVLLPAPSRG